MGFLKRLFSLSSSKRGKKKRIPLECDPVEYALPYSEARTGKENNEHEAAASRLLRSSSAHFAVVNEVDYSNLPPLPHPVNSMLSTPVPASAAPSIRSTSTQPSYTVTIIGRETITRTEFPDANPRISNDAATTPKRDTKTTPRRKVNRKKVPVTPRDQDRLLRLRQDPSVASLLNMYDEEGRINSQAFSNTPPEIREYLGEGRDQIRRTGSTLRQLLGSPALDDGHDDFEGDISWAERFLAEGNGSMTSLNSESSVGLETPKDFAFSNNRSNDKLDHPTFLNDHDLSTSIASDLCPTISSLEVELSGATESSAITESICKELEIIKTPRAASQIFSFLTEKKQPEDRGPPATPSPSTKSTDGLPLAEERPSALPLPDDTQPRIFPKQSIPKIEPVAFPTAFDTPALKTIVKKEPSKSMRNLPQEESPTAHKTSQSGPSKQLPASRIPRGPRSSASTRSKSMPKPGLEETASLSTIASSSRKDVFTPAPTRQSHRRGGSRKYSMPLNDGQEDHVKSYRTDSMPRQQQGSKAYSSRSCVALPAMENSPPPPATPPKDFRFKGIGSYQRDTTDSLPVTPIRHNSLLRVAQGIEPPSPASSSELSPLARQMMTTVREKRMQAREKERERSRSRSRLRA